MNYEDIKVGKTYHIDTGVLIASPEKTGRTFEGQVHNTNGSQYYVFPMGDRSHNLPLYVFPHWLKEEVK